MTHTLSGHEVESSEEDGEDGKRHQDDDGVIDDDVAGRPAHAPQLGIDLGDKRCEPHELKPSTSRPFGNGTTYSPEDPARTGHKRRIQGQILVFRDAMRTLNSRAR